MYEDEMISSDAERRLERVIVLEVVSDESGAGLSRQQLEAQLDQPDPRDLTDALEQLGAAGVVDISGETVRASRASLRLRTLGLIAV
jgi:hypothetical protein